MFSTHYITSNNGRKMKTYTLFLTIALTMPFVHTTNATIVTYDNWTDVNKYSDRGLTNPSGSLDTSDSKMCWAAASSNVLNFTGWTVDRDGDKTLEIYDDVYNEFLAEFSNGASSGYTAYKHYANTFWSEALTAQGKTWDDYFYRVSDDSIMMETIADFMELDYGIYVSITNDRGSLGHAITAWGYETDDTGLFTRIAVTDSDRGYGPGGAMIPMLQWYDVAFNASLGRWYLQDYGTDVYIRRIDAFAPNDLLAPIPEPATVLLFGISITGLLIPRLRRKSPSLL